MNIEKRIQDNEEALNRLFQKFNIKARGIEGIREGAELNGSTFIGMVADILNDKISNFSDENEVGPPNYDYNSTTGTKKNILDTLNNIIGFSSKAGDAIYKVRSDISGPINYRIGEQPTTTSNNNFLLIGSAIAIVIIIIIVLKK